ncbi:AI-2E family transporter [Caulobacter sp. NIBR2454]|uniref:AI-2E family transporter n=1 Tax=Caulobacter sp. NIBR2454 TaxID=3015996 RepID=UPI0022B75344|nr:AI-2E family transporter [Caulobacter sp. NIBR2454]
MAAIVPVTSRSSLIIIAAVAVGFTLYFLRDILTPLALAVFLAVMIDGFARILGERIPGFPARAALPVAVVASILIFGLTTWFVAENAATFVNQLIHYGPRIDGRIAQVADLLGIAAPPPMRELITRFNATRYIGPVAAGFQNFASDAVFVLIYLGFIIASRRGFKQKARALFVTDAERQDAIKAFDRIRSGVERYLWIQTVTGVIIAFGSWIAMVAVGLDSALFWALLIFLASYIPVVGGVIGVALPPVFALVQFETWWQAIVLLSVLQTVQFVVANVILPRMQGDSLNMDPVVVLLALAFWSLVWGLPGAFLSTPLAVMTMIILAQFEGGRKIAILLSADGDPLGADEAKGRPRRKKPVAKPSS